jgi:hypothetical protein
MMLGNVGYSSQGTGNALHRGAERPSTSQEDVDRIQERRPQKSTTRASLHLGMPQSI